MSRAVPFIALALIVVGIVGIVIVGGQAQAQTPFGNPQGYGFPGGMMGNGFGMMGRGGFSRGYGYDYAPNVTPLTLDQAVTRAQQYVAALNNADLAVAEVMEFSNHLYARVKEKSTGINAFELLLDRSGGASPEPGPNMMWNAKYSPMRWMMGGYWFGANAQNTVTPAQAKDKAQQYLDTFYKGTQVAEDADAFYGYYTLDVLRDGKPIGMLGVNGTTGVVWYHTWHGTFVGEKEIK